MNEGYGQALAPMDINTLVGPAAAICTTVSYFPQLYKCWKTGEAGDLSLVMFSVLSTGIALWCVYGFLQEDYVIIAANGVSLVLLCGILYFKLREGSSHDDEERKAKRHATAGRASR